MNPQIGTKSTDDKFVIALTGSFNFTIHRDFRKAGEDALKNGGGIIEIDLEKVEYLDSSALGMLLLLRERALAANKEVTLIRCQEFVRQVLNVANFHKLFAIQ